MRSHKSLVAWVILPVVMVVSRPSMCITLVSIHRWSRAVRAQEWMGGIVKRSNKYIREVRGEEGVTISWYITQQ